MSTLLWIIAATTANSLVALAGAFSLLVNKERLEKLLIVLVGFSAGALLSGAFFHLISESLETLDSTTAFAYLFVGFVLFFVMERFLHWHHCHDGVCDIHAFSYLVLIGDAIHNFIDGLVIAASFLVSTGFGIITTLLILGHELPQELGDFGVLVYGGFSRRKALLFNLISQISCIIGGVLGFFVYPAFNISAFLLPFAAGGFIYISASDLIPELHKQPSFGKTIAAFLFFLLGIAFMVGTKLIFE